MAEKNGKSESFEKTLFKAADKVPIGQNVAGNLLNFLISQIFYNYLLEDKETKWMT
jgi:hypothetical protein